MAALAARQAPRVHLRSRHARRASPARWQLEYPCKLSHSPRGRSDPRVAQSSSCRTARHGTDWLRTTAGAYDVSEASRRDGAVRGVAHEPQGAHFPTPPTHPRRAPRPPQGLTKALPRHSHAHNTQRAVLPPPSKLEQRFVTVCAPRVAAVGTVGPGERGGHRGHGGDREAALAQAAQGAAPHRPVPPVGALRAARLPARGEGRGARGEDVYAYYTSIVYKYTHAHTHAVDAFLAVYVHSVRATVYVLNPLTCMTTYE